MAFVAVSLSQLCTSLCRDEVSLIVQEVKLIENSSFVDIHKLTGQAKCSYWTKDILLWLNHFCFI